MNPRPYESPRLNTAIARVARRSRLRALLHHAARWWGGALAMGAGALVIDATSPLVWWVRGGVWCVLALAIATGLSLAVRAACKRSSALDRDAMLGAMEEAWGLPPSALRSADQLGHLLNQDAVGRALTERCVARAEASLAGAEPHAPVVSVSPSTRVIAPGTVGVLLLVLLAMLSPSALTITALRLLDPLGDHPPVAPVRLTVVLPVEPPLVGDDVRVTVRAEGEAAQDVWLTIDGGARLATSDRGDGAWGATLVGLREPVTIRAHTEGAYSRAVRVEPLTLARVLGTRVRVLPPAHASGIAPTLTAQEPLRAVEGSTIEVRFELSIPAMGMQNERGALVGEAQGRSVTVRRAVGAGGAWAFTPVTEAGSGPDAATVEPSVNPDAPPVLGFVGENIDRGLLRVVQGEVASIGVEASDDVALHPSPIGVLVPEGVRVRVRGVPVDHALRRAVIAVDPDGLAAGDEFEIIARVRDTVPGRPASEATLLVRVISQDEADERALEATTIDRLTGPSERVSGLIEEQRRAAAIRAIEKMERADGATAFEREAAERAKALRERIERDGITPVAQLEAERTLRVPAERLRLADDLRRVAEALTRLTDDQVLLAAASRSGGLPLETFGEPQTRHAARLAAILEALVMLGDRAASAPMDAERLVSLRAALQEAKDRLEAVVTSEGRPIEPKARDIVLTELHFALSDVLEPDQRSVPLMRGADAALRTLARVRRLITDDPVPVPLDEVEELVLALRREATAPLPVMGVSAITIAERVRTMGVTGVMQEAAALLNADDAVGGAQATLAAEMLLSLRDDEDDDADPVSGAEGDAPLSLTPGGDAQATSNSSASGGTSGGAVQEALDRLAQNREQAEAEARDADKPSPGAQDTPEGEPSSRGGGSGGSEGSSLGGQSVSGAATESDERAPPERGAGVRSWVVTEDVELTPGEAERLVRVPERYRALVAAYLRAIGREAESQDTGRIE